MICGHKILLKSGIEVPCGKCPACLANRRQEWIFRLKEEMKSAVFGLFVTLTYDNDHLPKDLSVNVSDIQHFHKRLRKNFTAGDMRFFLTSEYGDHTARPHYHGLYFFKTKYEQDYIYDIFTKSWKNGFCKFGEIELASIVYCTKYCLKLTPVPPGRKKPFQLMSKMNGGLGSGYLDLMSDWHLETENFNYVSADGKQCRMPRYYRDRINPYKGSFKYNPLYYRLEQDRDQDSRKTENRHFTEFVLHNKFSNEGDALRAYERVKNKQVQNRDELLIKHTKKQKM